MNGLLGYGFVALGFSASLFGALGGIYALVTQRLSFLKIVKRWVWLVVAASVGAFVVMEVALFQRDYSVAYVQQVGSPKSPPLYNFAALWSSLEGSLLLWTLVLGIYLAVVNFAFRKRSSDLLFSWALVVMLLVTAFFFALMIGPANPFASAVVPPGFEGPGPNPLLQNHILMAIHPPMLYLGYVGFTVPFAFAVASLITGRFNEGWLLETRRFSIVAWGFLTFGILLGAWWSYEVLGWGGYWAWDPVENASLLPWLTATAYIHSVMIQERRGLLRVWNLSLVCATFCLTILGTFLTRSDLLDSVHAFSSGEVDSWFLSFFALVTLSSVGLIAWRGDQLRSTGAIGSLVSREGAFMANNFLFGALAFVILLGTTFPLFAELINNSRLTVSRPYFDSMARPLGLLILFLMAAAPVLPWGKATAEVVSTRLFWPAVIGVATMLGSVVFGSRGVYTVLAFGLGGFAAASAGKQILFSLRQQRLGAFLGRKNGGMIVHIGVVILAVGLVASESAKTNNVVRLSEGDSVQVEDHTFVYKGSGTTSSEQKISNFADIEIDGDDVYAPAKTHYRSRGMIVDTPSVRTGFTEDVFLALAAPINEETGDISLRIIIWPMVAWIWTGGILMVIGSGLALIPKNFVPGSFRNKRRKHEADGPSEDVVA